MMESYHLPRPLRPPHRWVSSRTLALCWLFLGWACSDGTESTSASEPRPNQPSASVAQKAPSSTSGEAKEAKTSPADANEDRKERARNAYQAAFCAVRKADPKGADAAYQKNGFKSHSHFLRVWKYLSKKDSAWAEQVTSEVEKSGCK